ncbi:AGC protein kinase [Phytophthora nicotianae P1976]|uniref:protein-serine/threonine phosphatase n=1 Tax=Phytophthora nicotianae P1976 TaxID=1317066 RepID=A0A080ZSL8_PHYNI|nr:AGC protein kinase [Phytophthora nicotianae P1976]
MCCGAILIGNSFFGNLHNGAVCLSWCEFISWAIMGCGASIMQRPDGESKILAQLGNSNGAGPNKPVRSPLTKEQINSRIVCSPKTMKSKVTAKLSAQYAFVSQRGYYPDALDKPNQDSCTILPAFMGDAAKMYFGVFDGHGTTGDLCASFVRKECPERLVRILDRKNCSFLEAYSKSFEETNARLHASRIDDSLSGTTAICMFLDGEMIHVANVGDSRAVIATMSEGKLVAQPLSVDQTPYRSDERERVKRSGARVLTMDQLEGIAPVHDNWAANLNDQVDEDGDPPRIWSPYGAFPGTAFTRSLGDEIAETLGVIGVPEITSLQLTEDDRFVVIASDGVFEFLTSQAVVDMVAQYEDPLEACHKVVAESYRLWLTYELRTDDITIICVYFHFSEGVATASGASLGTTPRTNSVARRLGRQTSEKVVSQQLRPVRRGMSKEKRRAQMRKDMAQLVKEEDLAYRVSDHAIPKSSTELRLLEELTKNNWLFRQLTQAQKDDIFAVMERISVREGDMVIRQGDPGDKFYIVECGDYQVSVRGDDGGPESIVHTYTQPPVNPDHCGDLQPASFGELALMHNSPRSSSVKALSAGVLWAIDCRAFRRVFIKAPTSVLVQTLKKVDVLKTLTKAQLERLANNLTEVVYHDGDYIINQGDVGDTFYVIQEGAVICTIWEDDPSAGPGKKRTSREVLRLKKNQYFGERALLNDAPRAANVISVGRTKLLQVGRREFEEVLGSLQDMIEADRLQREARHNFETAVKNLIYSPAAHGARRNSMVMGPLRPQDMRFRYVVQQTDFGFLAVYQGVSDTKRFFTVNVFSFQQVAADRRGDEAARYVTTHKTIRLDTPMLPEMVAFWRDDRALYLSFDTAMVTDLAAMLADEPSGRFEKESTVRGFAAQALLMLEYIHQAGYAYRNLSSENVMVDTHGYLQLHDFRHMKRLPDETRTYTICGTPEYMAPEMVSARGHTASADIWSLGILIYEMLCGRTPFSIRTNEEDPNTADKSFGSEANPTSRLTNEKDVTMAVYSKISRHNKGALKFTRDDLSAEACDLVQQLLDPFPDDRLGGQGLVDIVKGGSVIRAHPWFQEIDWVVLASKTADREHAEALTKLMDEQLSSATSPEMPILEPVSPHSGDLDWLENF